MTYEEQQKIEKLNQEILASINSDDLLTFYAEHNQKETMLKFGLRTTKQLTKALTMAGYDFSTKKPSKFKGKPAARSHESYVAGGIKSSQTQQQHWLEKSDEEKEAWSIKQSIAHSNDTYAVKKAADNRAYRASLSPEEEARQNELRSQSMKAWWDNLSTEEKEVILQNRFKNGQSYSQKDSGPNLAFAEKLKQANIDFEREFCLDKKFFDFKIADVLVEINPTFTHNSSFTPFEYNQPLSKIYHQQKSEIAKKYNYKCIHIFDWDDQEKIINLLSNNQQTIYGRDCQIKEIDTADSNKFLAAYHLQGPAKALIKIGLYYNNELTSLMTFGKPRYNKNYEWELIRYCSKAKVLGGAEKLFKYFITNYAPGSIISYCDLSKFSGSTYTKLHFTLIRKPTPSKHWYNVRTKEHYTDALLRQQGFSRLVHKCDASEDNLTTTNNRQLMLDAGFVEVYDCGQAAYGWHI